jgi:nicotinate-nucleotide--dimethylbenzimidazole phosphoribosyltransferase
LVEVVRSATVARSWPRPIPTVGDRSSAAERATDPTGWAFPKVDRDALERIMTARRDIRRFRPDPVPDEIVSRILLAAHHAPSVGHSQPWRFVLVSDPARRAAAALMADRARLAQAGQMTADASRKLLDLDLEGIREAPFGLVVCCDRRADPAGVLGQATFSDADLWSCACAIQNLWLAARAEGLGVGWVTLFEPSELASLVGAPEGVSTLGWLCVGWPDERPPEPGLERRGWSVRLDLEDLVISERWPDEPVSSGDAGSSPGGPDRPGNYGPDRALVVALRAHPGAPPPPVSHVRAPQQRAVVGARDGADGILSAPGALGILDRTVDKVLALADSVDLDRGVLVLAACDHPVHSLGVSAYDPGVTRTVAEAAVAGVSVGAVAAAESGLDLVVVDAGIEGTPLEGAARWIRPEHPRGDLVGSDALSPVDVEKLVTGGRALGETLAVSGYKLVVLGEVGVANTTPAAALAAALLDVGPDDVVGLGSGSDSTILARKRRVVAQSLARYRSRGGGRSAHDVLAALGGGELAVLTGVVLGAAGSGGVVVLDGLAASIPALIAVEGEPAVAAHLVAGQRSREPAHPLVLEALGLEPLLDLRFRAGEGAGAAMAVKVLRAGLAVRLGSARTAPLREASPGPP